MTDGVASRMKMSFPTDMFGCSPGARALSRVGWDVMGRAGRRRKSRVSDFLHPHTHSHNHPASHTMPLALPPPTAVEVYQGKSTGLGG